MYKGFKQIQLRDPKRSKFDLSHEKRLSTRLGRLTPIFISETLPNDTFKVNAEIMLRLAPMKFPVMHAISTYVHFFFVPMRILGNWFEDFITNGRTGEETAPVPTFFKINQALGIGEDLLDVGSLGDYLGVPPIPDADVALWGGNRSLLAAPWLAYQKIWFDYYRDRNFVPDDIIDFPNIPEGEAWLGEDATLATVLNIRNRCWTQDYFTTAATSTQRGFEVLMPLQGTGTVSYLSQSLVKTSAGGVNPDPGTWGSDSGAMLADYDTLKQPARIENIDEVEITTSDVSINDFRMALALQSWQERQQVAGSRMNETIMAHFHRRTSDARLQRAEYLGGGKVHIPINEVVTTAYSQDSGDVTVPPASMSGHAKAFGNTNRFTYNCEEWGFVIGLLSVMPTPSYDQGLPRMFAARQTFLDYPWSVFAHLGEQEVKKYELYFDPTNYQPNNEANFGYQSRYSDWKNIPSSNHGDMRTGQSLEAWSLTRKFASSPTLGETFVTFEDALQDRIFNVSGVDTVWCYIFNQVSVIRTLPYYGTPSNLN